jgi:hypothetical protein
MSIDTSMTCQMPCSQSFAHHLHAAQRPAGGARPPMMGSHSHCTTSKERGKSISGLLNTSQIICNLAPCSCDLTAGKRRARMMGSHTHCTTRKDKGNYVASLMNTSQIKCNLANQLHVHATPDGWQETCADDGEPYTFCTTSKEKETTSHI